MLARSNPRAPLWWTARARYSFYVGDRAGALYIDFLNPYTVSIEKDLRFLVLDRSKHKIVKLTVNSISNSSIVITELIGHKGLPSRV